MGVWVKICGITRPDDARAAWAAGADAIGLNFVGGPRQISPAAAAPILEHRPPDRAAVALVILGPDGMDPALAALLGASGVRDLQLYGHVTPERVAGLAAEGWRSWVVCRAPADRLGVELAPWFELQPGRGPVGVVLDAHDVDRAGGTGKTLDWAEVARALAPLAATHPPRIVLAGGLTSQNVSEAIRVVRPWGVDVSSGVERAPGLKDHDAVAAFIRAARGAPWCSASGLGHS